MTEDSKLTSINFIPHTKGYEIYRKQVELQKLKEALFTKRHEHDLLIAVTSRKKTEINSIEKQIKKLLG